MATNFPTGLDSLSNPLSTDKLNNPSHATQHANANDAIEALEAKVGVNGSAVTSSLDYKVSTLESNSLSKTLVDAKGDLYAGTAADTVGRLPVGTNGHVLIANSGETTGLQWRGQHEVIVVTVASDGATLTTGTNKINFRMPFAMTVTQVRASVSTASSSGTPTFDINENGVSILSTLITIDANEKSSVTAVTAPVISDSSLADDAEISIDIDAAGTGTKGAKVYIIGYRS